jgi:hypothetical protein
MSTRSRHPVDSATARRLAVEADADPRTILRELAEPGSVHGMAGQRVRSVLARHGLAATPNNQPSPPEAA